LTTNPDFLFGGGGHRAYPSADDDDGFPGKKLKSVKLCLVSKTSVASAIMGSVAAKPLGLQDMPPDVVRHIMDRSGNKGAARCVARYFKDCVDDGKSIPISSLGKSIPISSLETGKQFVWALRGLGLDLNDRRLPKAMAFHGSPDALYALRMIESYPSSPGRPWDEAICSEAARRGHLTVLQWARANGCPWDHAIFSAICREAARTGHLPVLQWARANGCPWDHAICSAICSDAARNEKLHVIVWALETGCPWDEATCKCEAERRYRQKVLRWARANHRSWAL
jgi:hypothetical protein